MNLYPLWRRTEPNEQRSGAGRASRFILAALGLLPGVTTEARAQTTLVGTVYDSINAEPLSDAAVFLWETPYRAATDDAGHFRIDDVPPGDYSILFFHTRLGEMGISPGPQPLTVAVDEPEIEVHLAMPSMRTFIESQCLFEERLPGTGILAGWVRDGTSDVRLGGTSVVFAWEPPDSSEPEQLMLRTGAGGWYYTCAAPAEVPLLGWVSFFGREAPRREVLVDEGGFTESDFTLETSRASTLVGRLLDGSTGEPVNGAEVWLRGTYERRITDDQGVFTMPDVHGGTYMLMVEHLAYGTKRDTLEVPPGQRLTLQMHLDTRPIPIAPITVEVDAPAPISARMSGGIVITRDQIDEVRQRSRDVSDILRSLHVPGVLVRHRSNGTTCVGYTTGQVRTMQTGCVSMVVFINDVRATDADIASRLPPESIERMVIYKPVDAGNLFGLGAGNGVWMIYTRGN